MTKRVRLATFAVAVVEVRLYENLLRLRGAIWKGEGGGGGGVRIIQSISSRELKSF